jgi:hypothetical protein
MEGRLGSSFYNSAILLGQSPGNYLQPCKRSVPAIPTVRPAFQTPSRCVCDQVGNVFYPQRDNTYCGGIPATTDPRLWYPLNAGGPLSSKPAFTLPALSTYGLGNAPPTLFWDPYSRTSTWRFPSRFRSRKVIALNSGRILLNAFNWVNFSDPNVTLQYNYNNGTQNNANFGQITSQTGLPATGQRASLWAR